MAVAVARSLPSVALSRWHSPVLQARGEGRRPWRLRARPQTELVLGLRVHLLPVLVSRETAGLQKGRPGPQSWDRQGHHGRPRVGLRSSLCSPGGLSEHPETSGAHGSSRSKRPVLLTEDLCVQLFPFPTPRPPERG